MAILKPAHMKNTFNWKKGTFSSTIRIFSGEELIGELTDHAFKQKAEGHIRNKQYRFKTKGLFKQDTQIMEGESDLIIGNISYNSMMSKATIQFPDRTVYWKYDNKWQTRWSLFDNQGTLINFAGGHYKGSIECDEVEELLLLSGMFVTNFYQQAMIAIMVAIFIPIWVTVIN